MPKPLPLVSWLMPVRNGGVYLKTTLESIEAQTHSRWELVVIDDASSDSTGTLLKKFAKRHRGRVRIFHNEFKKGISRSLNDGLPHTTGSYIARIDADDISLPRRLEMQVAHLENHPQCVAVGCQVDLINADTRLVGKKCFPLDGPGTQELIGRFIPLQHSAGLFRGNVLRELKYNPNLDFAEDLDLLYRLMEIGQLHNLEETLLLYRLHRESETHLHAKAMFRSARQIRRRYQNSGEFRRYSDWVAELVPQRLLIWAFEKIRLNPVP